MAQTQSSEAPIPQAKLDRLAAFLDKARPVEGVVGPQYELERVSYTSPTDAAARINDSRPYPKGGATVIVTTDDNWAHAAGLSISDGLADFVEFLPLGGGAVAIKAVDQVRGRSYPPFVLYADGDVAPLRVTQEPRAVDDNTDLLPASSGFGFEIGLDAWMLGADVKAAEIFGLPPVPPQTDVHTFDHVPGREGPVNITGYLGIGDGIWRFSESTDNGRTWRTTDLALPLADDLARLGCDESGTCGVSPNTGIAGVAIGPDEFQAVALLDEPMDLPYYVRQLWVTTDEESFHRVPLPWERRAFSGIAFASDGALLLAEARDPLGWCAATCRPGQIWRLPPGGIELEPQDEAPRLHGPRFGIGLRYAGGGMTVARTGSRTIAISPDGYTWTEVTPGG